MNTFTSGIIAGLSSRLVTAPLDLIKIRLQLLGQTNDILGVYSNIIKNEGYLALWKGNISGLCLYGGFSGIQFYILDKLNSGVRGVDGGIASTCAYVVTYPFDMLRTHFSISKTNNIIFPKFADLYRGFTPSLIQIVPYMAIVFQLESNLSHKLPHSASGLLSAAIAKALLMPLDVIKRRMQIQNNTLNLQGSYVLKAPVYRQSIISTGISILRNEGWRALYSGLSISILKSAPATAITFHVYNKLVSSS